MPIRLSALGFAANYTDPTKIAASNVRLTPLVLARPILQESPNVEVTLTGAGSSAEAANVSASGSEVLTALGRLGPLGLHQGGYNLAAKVGHETVTLTGAEIRVQGEELEGTHVTIRLLGATVFFNGQDLDQEFVDNGTRIVNDDASTDEPTHVNQDDITGFRFYNDDKMHKTWDGLIVRKRTFDEKHGQLITHSTRDHITHKRRNPEEPDLFISTSVAPEDL